MIKTIVFDWGNVLAPSDDVIAVKELVKEYDLDGKALLKELGTQQYEFADKSDDTTFFKIISEKFKIDPEKLKKYLCDVPPNDMLDLAKKLKSKGFKVHLLSDQVRFKGEHIKNAFDISFFDTVTFSYEIGVIKKSIESFRIFLEKTNENPNECLFIDDREDNISNAKKLGFNTILFKSKDQFLKDLNGFGILID